MSALQAIKTLLVGAAPLAGVGGDKVFIGEAQGTALPVVVISHISTTPLGRIDAQAEFGIVTSRIQVTVSAREYSVAKKVLTACRKACNFQRGVLGGVNVISIIRDIDGPDMEPGAPGIYDQSTDFMVTFHEPN